MALVGLVAAASVFAYRGVTDFVHQERTHFAAASKVRHQAAALDALYDAAQQLEEHGAFVRYAKMHSVGSAPFQHVDLTDWRGDAQSLRPLKTFARLTETGKPPSLHIRLGPTLTNDAVDVLVELPNLRTLELNGAKIDAGGVARLHSSNPHLTIVDAKPVVEDG